MGKNIGKKTELIRIVFYFSGGYSVYWQEVEKPKGIVSGQYYQASVYDGSELKFRTVTWRFANKTNSLALVKHVLKQPLTTSINSNGK